MKIEQYLEHNRSDEKELPERKIGNKSKIDLSLNSIKLKDYG